MKNCISFSEWIKLLIPYLLELCQVSHPLSSSFSSLFSFSGSFSVILSLSSQTFSIKTKSTHVLFPTKKNLMKWTLENFLLGGDQEEPIEKNSKTLIQCFQRKSWRKEPSTMMQEGPSNKVSAWMSSGAVNGRV